MPQRLNDREKTCNTMTSYRPAKRRFRRTINKKAKFAVGKRWMSIPGDVVIN